MKLPKRLERTTIYESNWIRLHVDQVEMPSGQIVEKYHQLDFPFESAVVIPVNEEGKICMIRSLRYSTQSIEWELPAGRIDDGESIEVTAVREMKEETGYDLLEPQWIQAYNPSNGMSNEVMNVVTGKVASEKTSDFDLDEVVSVHWKSKEEVRQMMKDGEIKDGISLVPLLMWVADLV